MKRSAVTSLILLFAGACGGRPEFWSEPASASQAVCLRYSVALTDPLAERVLMLSADSRQQLAVTARPTCKHPIRSVAGKVPGTSTGNMGLFTMCRGDEGIDLDRPGAAKPSLVVMADKQEDGTFPAPKTYEFNVPRTSLALDPGGRWAVLYSDAKQTQLVDNPNEILIVDLTKEPGADSAVKPHSLRADQGGVPVRPSFAKLGERTVLVVQRELDVALLDLENPGAGELTARLTANLDRVAPDDVVVSTPDQSTDTLWVAIKQKSDQRSIVTLRVQFTDRLVASPNILDAGGSVSALAWVRTEVGGPMRLAVAVPGTTSAVAASAVAVPGTTSGQAVLIDPITSDSTTVALQYPYGNMTVVTAIVAAGAATDTVLLWGGDSNTGPPALWSPGTMAAGTSYRSVDYLTGISSKVNTILDVGLDRPELKLLLSDVSSSSGVFHVLDLKSRQAAPLTLDATGIGIAYSIDPSGRRLWNFDRSGSKLCVMSLKMQELSPRCDLRPDRPVDDAFEIRSSADADDPRHMLLALHQWDGAGVTRGNVGVTVYPFLGDDITQIEPSQRLIYSSLLLKGGFADDDR